MPVLLSLCQKLMSAKAEADCLQGDLENEKGKRNVQFFAGHDADRMYYAGRSFRGAEGTAE